MKSRTYKYILVNIKTQEKSSKTISLTREEAKTFNRAYLQNMIPLSYKIKE
jgi:hypothetical protein